MMPAAALPSAKTVLRTPVFNKPAAVQLEGVKWCELTAIGLKVNRKSASFEEMESTLDRLIVVAKGSPFGLGDVMCLGESRHGDKWAQAVDVNKKTGIKVKTLLEYRRVSEKIPFSIRLENENLEWSHYQVISNQPKEARASLIRGVADNGWTVNELKREITARAAPAINADGIGDYLSPQFKSFLADYIATLYAFLNKCTYDPFKKEIERTIKAARYQSGRTEVTDYQAVRAQVDKMCTTSTEIAEEVPLTEEEITRLCHLLTDTEPDTYEWRPIGVNTEVARGTRTLGIFRKDCPAGSDFEAYHPHVEYGDDDEEHF